MQRTSTSTTDTQYKWITLSQSEVQELHEEGLEVWTITPSMLVLKAKRRNLRLYVEHKKGRLVYKYKQYIDPGQGKLF